MKSQDNQAQVGSSITEALVEILTRRGIIEKPSTTHSAGRDSKNNRQKFAYHNTELLLKNYRQIVWQSKLQYVEIAASLEAPLEDMDALLSRVDAEIGMGNKRLEARLEVQKRYRLMISQVNEALSLLKQKPGNGEFLYELIYLTYISPESHSSLRIAERLELSRRHYYRLRQQAVTILSTRLWGAPSKELDIWLDLLDVLGGKGSE